MHENPPINTKTELVLKTDETTNKIDLKDPKLLDTIARRYGNLIVGESRKIKTLVCCLLSKDLPKRYRTSVIIPNVSSTGKSYVLNNVLEPFRDNENPDQDPVIDYTEFSEAHFKRSQKNVDGKIIKLEQLEKRDEKGKLSFRQLKHLLSEGRLKIGNVDQNEKGERQPIDFEINGVPVIVTTVTEFNIDSETANRFLMMQLDESEEQTDRINCYTLSQYSNLSTDNYNEDMEELRKLFKSFKEMGSHVDQVLIPYDDQIHKIIPKTLQMRRDLKKILNLTCLIAFIHSLNRDHFRKNKHKDPPFLNCTFIQN